MFKTIDHIGIMTSNLKDSVKFYTDVLGFSISMEIEMEEAGLSVVFVEKDGGKIELMEHSGAPKRPEALKVQIGDIPLPLNDHISLSVENIEDVADELKKKGVVFDVEPTQMEGGLKYASIKDPNGVQIELIEYPQ